MFSAPWLVALGLLSSPSAFSQIPFATSELGIKGFSMPKDQTSGKVKMQIDLTKKGTVSPYIYGYGSVSGNPGLWDPDNQFSLFRMGGNRFTGYNWENNLSHAGSDWRYQNDTYLCVNISPVVTPNDCKESGGVIKAFAKHAFGLNGSGQSASILVTVPLIGYVAYKATDGDVCPAKDQARDSECRNRNYLSTHFRESRPKGASKPTVKPDLTDSYVNQNDFVYWLYQTFPEKLRKKSQIFFSLDNEVALWSMTHKRLRPAGDYCKHNPTYSEILARNIEYATMIKEIEPDALVFGPVDYGWYSMTSLQGVGKCDGNQGKNFHEFYLKGLKKAGETAKSSRPLVNVLDIHWYSEIEPNKGQRITSKDAPNTTEYFDARVQAPRSLWDPTFVEDTWIARDVGNEAIRLIPRLSKMIDKHHPGMGLAITEYTYGGENHISGAIAQADVLGIFGREGVFAASYWPLADSSPYIYAAFRMFRNYDGKKGRFGDVGFAATTSSASRSSVYASEDPRNPGGLVVVAINKTHGSLPVEFSIQGPKANYKQASIYQLREGAPKPAFFKKIPFSELKNLSLPANTIYTLVID